MQKSKVNTMNITINRNSETSIYVQIKCAIEKLITSQELIEGYKMPSERKLAAELGVHRNTIVKAYSELIAEGYLYASRQAPKGYFVKSPEAANTFTGRFFPLGKRLRYDFNEKEKTFFQVYDSSYDNDYISMGGIVVDRDCYPIKDITEIASNMFHAQISESERLKENICRLLSQDNMYVNTKNIQIVSETNQALYHLMDLFLNEGDCVIAEEPLMPDNAALFKNKRVKLVTVPMEEDGINLAILENMIIKHRPKFVYTLPNYHNPTGITMSIEKRIKLLNITHKYGIPIIEEDSQGDFRYTENLIPSLYALDKNQSVVYIDSFTLSFPYNIKIGYIVGPYDLTEMLGRLIMITETTVNTPTHYLLNEYIERGHYQENLNHLVREYKERRDILCEELDKIRDKGITYLKAQGGLVIWCSLSDNIKEKQLFRICIENGLLITPGFVYYPYGYEGCGHIRLSFSSCSKEKIVKGVQILGKALDICSSEGTDSNQQ